MHHRTWVQLDATGIVRSYILKGQGLGNGHASGEGRYRMGLACGRFAGLVGEYIYTHIHTYL